MQTRPDEFQGVVSSTTSILRNEGIAAFWKGAVPTAGGMILENCMAFGVNEALKRAFPDNNDGSAQTGPPSLVKPFLMVRLGDIFFLFTIVLMIVYFLSHRVSQTFFLIYREV